MNDPVDFAMKKSLSAALRESTFWEKSNCCQVLTFKKHKIFFAPGRIVIRFRIRRKASPAYMARAIHVYVLSANLQHKITQSD